MYLQVIARLPCYPTKGLAMFLYIRVSTAFYWFSDDSNKAVSNLFLVIDRMTKDCIILCISSYIIYCIFLCISYGGKD